MKKILLGLIVFLTLSCEKRVEVIEEENDLLSLKFKLENGYVGYSRNIERGSDSVIAVKTKDFLCVSFYDSTGNMLTVNYKDIIYYVIESKKNGEITYDKYPLKLNKSLDVWTGIQYWSCDTQYNFKYPEIIIEKNRLILDVFQDKIILDSALFTGFVNDNYVKLKFDNNYTNNKFFEDHLVYAGKLEQFYRRENSSDTLLYSEFTLAGFDISESLTKEFNKLK